jgi:hypothetical protein
MKPIAPHSPRERRVVAGWPNLDRCCGRMVSSALTSLGGALKFQRIYYPKTDQYCQGFSKKYFTVNLYI